MLDEFSEGSKKWIHYKKLENPHFANDVSTAK